MLTHTDTHTHHQFILWDFIGYPLPSFLSFLCCLYNFDLFPLNSIAFLTSDLFISLWACERLCFLALCRFICADKPFQFLLAEQLSSALLMFSFILHFHFSLAHVHLYLCLQLNWCSDMTIQSAGSKTRLLNLKHLNMKFILVQLCL